MRKLSICLLLLGISLKGMSQTQSASEHKAHLEKLSKAQSMTDNLVKNLGLTLPKQKIEDRDQPQAHSLFQIHDDLKSTRIQSGKLLYGTLLNRLVVGPDGSPVILILDDDQNALSGLRLLGLARQSGSSGRLALEFSKISLSNGHAVNISATGLDESGAYGVAAQVFSSKALMVAGAMAGSFIAGLAASQQSQTTNAFGFQQSQPTGRNAILQGVAQTAADQSKRLIDEATSEKPILVLEAESRVTAYFQEEVKF